MARKGSFDPNLNQRAWFDEALTQEGTFDKDFIDDIGIGINTGSGSLIIIGYSPQITLTLGVGSLVITGYAPSIEPINTGEEIEEIPKVRRLDAGTAIFYEKNNDKEIYRLRRIKKDNDDLMTIIKIWTEVCQ